jgi:Xaa-Pro aminopeptidase
VTAIATGATQRWIAVQNWTKDVREARRCYGKIAVERLKELDVGHGRIGVTGLGGGTRSPEGTISHGFWMQLREAFRNADIVDATPILAEARYVKSQEEIDVLTISMEIIEMGIAAKIAAARPGVKDWKVWAAAHYAMTDAGSELPVHCNWISGKYPTRTLTRPSMRLLERGDIIIDELEASWIGYRAQGVQPVFVEVANPVHQELIKAQRDIFSSIMEHLKPGVTFRELAEITQAAAQKTIPKSGLAAGAMARLTMHGRGAGDDGPIITSNARDPKTLATALQENMAFILKPSVETSDANGKYVCIWGDTVVVTPRGGCRLGRRPHDLAVAG